MTQEHELATQADALLRLVSRLERLEALPRTGWLVSGITSPESIAAHSYMVCIIALWIADHIPQEVHTERLLRMALVHDSGEAMLTDLPWPVKRFVGADVLHDAEERAAQILFHDSDPRWLQQLREYNQADSLEARIVKAADRIQLLAKALQYERQQRGDTARFWNTPRNFDDFGIPLARAVLDRLLAMRQEGSWWDCDFD